MTDDGVHVSCQDCGYPFGGLTGATGHLGEKLRCPECGGTGRHIEVGATLVVGFEVGLGGHVNDAESGATSRNKAYAWFYDRSEIFRKTGRRHRVSRSFNKKLDEYEEIIRDAETGELVRHVEEPLSKHRGHGSAKHANKES